MDSQCSSSYIFGCFLDLLSVIFSASHILQYIVAQFCMWQDTDCQSCWFWPGLQTGDPFTEWCYSHASMLSLGYQFRAQRLSFFNETLMTSVGQSAALLAAFFTSGTSGHNSPAFTNVSEYFTPDSFIHWAQQMNGGCVGHLFVFEYLNILRFSFLTVKWTCLYVKLRILLSTLLLSTLLDVVDLWKWIIIVCRSVVFKPRFYFARFWSYFMDCQDIIKFPSCIGTRITPENL